MHAVLVYPHQLFTGHPAIKLGRTIYMVEDPLFFTEHAIHAQKLMLHRLSMQSYASDLEARDYTIQYLRTEDLDSSEDIFERLKKDEVELVHIVDPTDDWLEKRIQKALDKNNLESQWHESPLFILGRDEAKKRFTDSKKRMAGFYQNMRRDFDYLMDGDGPAGGRFSFDDENRKKIPKNYQFPEDISYYSNESVAKAAKWVEGLRENGAEIYGTTDFWLPYTRSGALKALDDFLENRFADFGPYEDAIDTGHIRINHSALSPLINIGLLSPKEVVDAAIEYADKNDVPINSLEGFVRQIIGWREFIRASYEVDGISMRNSNFFNARRILRDSFWDGSTGIDPFDDTIERSLAYGYVHHIERLMVSGNIMLLSGIKPDEVYKWFMAMYVDAYDWVMVPNVYGMSQFADGGSFATKPYIAGANYIKKMSNYKKSKEDPSWEETLTALYWNFIAKHVDVFQKNHRMSMMPRLLEKMDEEKRDRHFELAKEFLEK